MYYIKLLFILTFRSSLFSDQIAELGQQIGGNRGDQEWVKRVLSKAMEGVHRDLVREVIAQWLKTRSKTAVMNKLQTLVLTFTDEEKRLQTMCKATIGHKFERIYIVPESKQTEMTYTTISKTRPKPTIKTKRKDVRSHQVTKYFSPSSDRGKFTRLKSEPFKKREIRSHQVTKFYAASRDRGKFKRLRSKPFIKKEIKSHKMSEFYARI